MNKNTKIYIGIIVCLLIIGAAIVKIVYFKNNNSNSNSTLSNSQNSDETIVPIETSTELSVNVESDEEIQTYSDYDTKINLNSLTCDGSGVNISDNKITISEKGTYYFSGSNSDASIEVNAEKAEVILVFDNVNLTSKNTAAINIIKAKKVIINLAENSTNTFSDSGTYTELTDEDEPNGTIFSKADLVINGKGKLIVNANYEDGIVSKDTLKILGANIQVTAKDDGIRGKDYTYIKDSTINITSSGDGIKATNDEENLGYILIENSNINIESEGDGIQAESVLNIRSSKIEIKTTGEIETKTQQFSMMRGQKTTNNESQIGDYGTSSKGLKAEKEITINSGTIKIESTDDSVHSNNYIIINGGTLELNSGDDGLHADNNVLINNGSINIIKSYEGLESSYVKINDGDISIVASDDGINICGGNDQSAFGRTGANSFSYADSGRELVINGGNIFVNSVGDGLDSNGSITMNDGYVVVAGATGAGNGILDYNTSFTVKGGTLIGYGGSDMWQGISSNTQKSLEYSISGNKGDKIELKDSNGNTAITFETEKTYNKILITTPDLQDSQTYKIYINGNETTSTTSTQNTNNNNSGMQGRRNF